MRRPHGLAAALALALALGAPAAGAAGFLLPDAGVSGLGNAFAGASAQAPDAGTVQSNPAGMAQLGGNQASTGAAASVVRARFSDGGSSLGGARLTGGDGGEAGQVSGQAGVFLSLELSPRLHLGLAIDTPLGLDTRYDAGWAGRYQSVDARLRSLNVNPAFAWQATERLSLGAGVDIEQANLDLSHAIDFGTLSGGVPQGQDGSRALSASGWGRGFNAGMLYRLAEDMRLGATVRSGIRHELSGDATVTGTPAALAGNPLFQNSRIHLDLRSPDILSFGVAQDYGGGALFLGEATWTRWSRFDELRIHYDNGAPDDVTTEQWRNTWRVALGSATPFGSAGTLRLGVAWEQSPVTDATRTAMLPDRNRVWLTTGAAWDLRVGSVEVGYAHLILRGGSIDQSVSAAGRLVGAYAGSADVLAVQGRLRF